MKRTQPRSLHHDGTPRAVAAGLPHGLCGPALPAPSYAHIRYLGDWTSPQATPFAFAASQMPEELPLHLPRIIAAPRVTEAMISELFLEAS